MIETIHEIPKSWRDLLATLQEHAPSAVLAGGALRDLDLGRQVKDLDFFVNVACEREALAVVELLNALAGFEIEVVRNDDTSYPQDQNLEVSLVVDLPHSIEDAPPAQIIFTDWNTSRIVERFDYGICRIAFDGKRLLRADEYEEDRDRQVFRIRRESQTAAGLRGSVMRYARLTAEKYAGWSWEPFADEFEFDCL